MELRAEGRVLSGFAAKYLSRSKLLTEGRQGYTEYIQPGAFRESLSKGAEIKALYDHNPSSILGTYPDTLQLEDTEQGLRFSLMVPNTTVGNDCLELVRRGDIKGCSIGMIVLDDEWNEAETERIINKAELREITLTAYPAYQETIVEARSRSWRQLI